MTMLSIDQMNQRIMSDHKPHIPVMMQEVLDALQPQDHDVILDCTFGAGGYTRHLLNGCQAHVIAVDRDPNVIPHVESVWDEFGKDRFDFVLTEFSNIDQAIQTLDRQSVTKIVADLGVSSMQLDEGERGFSFRHNASLDMRMDPNLPVSAADLVRDETVQSLTRIFRDYGEERYARRIAMGIDHARQLAPITETVQLAEIVRDSVPGKYANGPIHPATKTFQALRIAVNDELGHIEKLLQLVPTMLDPDGRFVCVSFHSLEDSLIKRALRDGFKAGDRGSRYVPDIKKDEFLPIWSEISKKPLQPSDIECQNNPRSRSARLRWAQRSHHLLT